MLPRIPYEIFREIIKLTADEYISPWTFGLDPLDPHLPPIKATHVCRSWRTALLYDPTMWTCIMPKFNGKDSTYVLDMLSRSGSAPLEVFIVQPPRRDPDDVISILPLIFNEMHRFRKLRFFISTRVARVACHLLKRPAPMLRKFHLNMSGFANPKRDSLREAYKDLFLGIAPVNLEHVHLQISAGLRDIRSVSLFKDLLRFHLSLVSETDKVIDGDVLLNILHSSPRLRILDILFPDARHSIVCSKSATYRASLPCLQELEVRGNCGVDILDYILGHLDFPADKIYFDINCRDSYPNVSDSTLLFHFLSQQRFTLLTLTPDFDLEEMNIEFFDPKELGAPSFRFYPQGEEGSAFRTLYNYRRPHMPFNALYNLIRELKLSDVKYMCLEMVLSASGILTGLLPLLIHLQHLRVHHEHLGDGVPLNSMIIGFYLGALMPRVQSNPHINTDLEPNSEDHQRHVSLCPLLHTLELVFPRRTKLDESFLDELARFCRIRKQAGYPLRSLAVFCEDSKLAESTDQWLQANKLECLHSEVRMIDTPNI